MITENQKQPVEQVPDFFRHLPSGEGGVSLAARGEASIGCFK
ncbi:hypothetical protein BAZOLSSOX_2228 [uncultured Gammaproteobacteria bacterium]|nr:hypothetical protein BAZOLSSOX_2228 [uncultured Gammaproteobacteria bacterium]